MFIRFTVLSNDSDTGQKVGVLVAGHTLRDEGDLSVAEHRQLRLCLKWFNDHLTIPPVYDGVHNKKALSWFKAEAGKPIKRMWELKSILDQHGIHVNVLKTPSPGKVIYEDGWQVVAVPPKGQHFA